MMRSPNSNFDATSIPSPSVDPNALDWADSTAPTSSTLGRSPSESVPQSPHEYGFAPVLKNRNFLVMWLGQVFSQLADKVYLVLMISLISTHLQPSGESISGWVSGIMIAFTIPAVLFGSIAGVFVDRWSKKTVLTSTNLLRGGLVLALPGWLVLTDHWAIASQIPAGFWVLLATTFLVSTLTQFFAPAEQAALPLIVPSRHLLSANSLYTTTMMASVIIGFAVGEPLLELAGQWMTRLGDWAGLEAEIGKEGMVGACYLIAGVILIFLKTSERPFDPDHPHPHVFQDIKDGIQYLGKNPFVRAAMLQLVLLFSVFAALAVLAVRLAEVMPAIDPDQFGFLLAAGGVGMGIGAAALGQFGQHISRSRLSLYGSIGMAIALVTLAFFTQQLWATLFTIGALGCSAAIVGVPMQTTIQTETPEAMRGKVFGLQNNAVNIALSLPLVLASVAENYLGLPLVFMGLGGMVAVGGVLTWYISRKGSIKTY